MEDVLVDFVDKLYYILCLSLVYCSFSYLKMHFARNCVVSVETVFVGYHARPGFYMHTILGIALYHSMITQHAVFSVVFIKSAFACGTIRGANSFAPRYSVGHCYVMSTSGGAADFYVHTVLGPARAPCVTQ